MVGGQLYQVPITKKYGEEAQQSGEIKQVGKRKGLQRKTNYILKDGKVYAQNMNYDPDLGTQEPLGKPYLSKAPGTTTININDKLSLHEGKQKITKTVSKEAMIKSPKLRANISKELKILNGPDWEYLQPFEKEQKIFEEMDRQIKETYPDKNVTFDEAQWVVFCNSGKLIKRYDDPYRTKKGVIKSFGYGTSPLESYLDK